MMSDEFGVGRPLDSYSMVQLLVWEKTARDGGDLDGVVELQEAIRDKCGKYRRECRHGLETP